MAKEIVDNLSGAENKICHSHPVWFLDVNPTVGCSKQKSGIRLMFWSGADLEEPGLKKAQEIEWDYKNLAKRKGWLERLK